jgi:HK97 family phage portal protein
MGVVRSLAAARQKRNALTSDDSFLLRRFGSATAAGQTVNAERALELSAIFAGVRRISASVAETPLKLRRLRADRGTEEDRGDARWEMLYRSPNPEQTSYEWRQMSAGQWLLHGNAYSEIVPTGRGVPAQLWPIPAWRVTPYRRPDSVLEYHVTYRDGRFAIVPPERMLHFRGLSPDGILGYDVAQKMRESLGISLAVEESAAGFYGRGGRPSGAIKGPAQLSEPAYRRLKDDIQNQLEGSKNHHRVLLLEEGYEWQQIDADADRAQLLGSRQFSVQEAARLLLMPPHMLGDMSNATFSNIEHQAIEYVTGTIRPILTGWEQRMEVALLTPAELRTHQIRFTIAKLLQGDMQSQAAYFEALFRLGAASPNDIRDWTDQTPVEGGDRTFVQLNLVPLTSWDEMRPGPGEEGESGGDVVPEPPTPPSTPEGPADRSRPAWTTRSAQVQIQEGRRRLRARYGELLANGAERMTRAEGHEVRAAADRFLRQRTAADFLAWVDSFYGPDGQFQRIAARTLLPILRQYAEAAGVQVREEVGQESEWTGWPRFLVGYLDSFLARTSRAGRTSMEALVRDALDEELDGETTADLLVMRMEEGGPRRAQEIAEWEVRRIPEAAARETWSAGGIGAIWMAVGDETCPYCMELDGREVSAGGTFVAEGGSVGPLDSPLRPATAVGHAPLHRGCDCMVLPGGLG